MRARTFIALAAVAALAVAGCSSGGDSGDESLSGGTLREGATGEGPPHLSPFRSADTASALIVDKVWVGLVEYDTKTSEPENLIAKEFTTEDNKTWTVEINKGWEFHNGEKITAQTFVDSWNFTANAKNAPDNSAFHARTTGYGPVNEGKEKEMKGLKVIDDTKFEIQFDSPWLAFPRALGYPAYFPLAKDCMDDVEACDKNPGKTGNGPMLMPTKKFDKSKEIELTRWDDYKGRKPQVEKYVMKVYTDDNAMFKAWEADEIDLTTVPDAEYESASKKYKDQLVSEKASSSFSYLGFPVNQKPFDNKKIRQAINLAVDRQALIDSQFQGRHAPADSFTPPEIITGGVKGTCGYCETDVDEAKKLLEEAGGWKSGKIQFYANEGYGHEKWMKVVGDQLKKNLGIDYKVNVLTWEEYLKLNTNHDFKGMFRLGWAPDYPLNENYLTGVYGGGEDGNGMAYENKEFTDLLAKGDNSTDLDKAIKYYQDAERVVGEDMPNIPLFFSETHRFIGPNVEKDSMTYCALNSWNWDLIKLKA